MITLPKGQNTFISIENCLVFQNRDPLIYVPKNFTHYYINSKRRFFIYLKNKDQMKQLMQILKNQKVNFYHRKSMFPDRQEFEEIVYHGNFKIKKRDLRRNLRRGTQLREPRARFERNDHDYRNVQSSLAQSKQICGKADDSTDLLKGNNQMNELKNQKIIQISEPKILDKSQPLTTQKTTCQNLEEQDTRIEYVADFGQIKIRNKEVLNIINDIGLLKALFRSQSKR